MNEKSKEFVHGKLILENNVFKNCYGKNHDIHLEYLEKAEIKNNTFDKEFTVTTNCVGEVIKEDNIIN